MNQILHFQRLNSKPEDPVMISKALVMVHPSILN